MSGLSIVCRSLQHEHGENYVNWSEEVNLDGPGMLYNCVR